MNKNLHNATILFIVILKTDWKFEYYNRICSMYPLNPLNLPRASKVYDILKMYCTQSFWINCEQKWNEIIEWSSCEMFTT